MNFQQRIELLSKEYNDLITRKNIKELYGNGYVDRYQYPILTAKHTPLKWRYDFNKATNPYFMERLGVNAVFNAGAIYLNNKYMLVARVEGYDRKSFFAVAESNNGVDNFQFWDYPILLPQTEEIDVNVYDMRITQHEDGYIYGIFCTERKNNSVRDLSAAIAQAGIVRTKDLKTWERLSDLKTNSAQQRNVVLHPEFVNGKYAFYTRPADGFIETGSGGGIGFGFSNSMENAFVEDEFIMDERIYHTITESKNGQGPSPIKTEKGWLHIAHGVRNTAAGLRYVLYAFLSELNEPWKIIKKPGGYFMAPEGEERIGDVSNVLFSNGMIKNNNDEIYIYYASSDTKMHVAATTVDKMLDYVCNTPQDCYYSHENVKVRMNLISKNMDLVEWSKI